MGRQSRVLSQNPGLVAEVFGLIAARRDIKSEAIERTKLTLPASTLWRWRLGERLPSEAAFRAYGRFLLKWLHRNQTRHVELGVRPDFVVELSQMLLALDPRIATLLDSMADKLQPDIDNLAATIEVLQRHPNEPDDGEYTEYSDPEMPAHLRSASWIEHPALASVTKLLHRLQLQQLDYRNRQPWTVADAQAVLLMLDDTAEDARV